MLLRVVSALLTATVLLAESTPAEKAKAKELFDKAAQMAGAAQPLVHVMAIMDVGEAYSVFDKDQAITLLRNAFGTTSAVAEDDRNTRTRIQGEIIKRMAKLNPGEACETLRSMAQPGKDAAGDGSAARKLARELLGRDKPEFDRLIEAINMVREGAEYPFDAVEEIYLKLPKDDPRRTIIFGNAVSAYKRNSQGITFPHLLARVWKELPREQAQTAVMATVSAIVERADDPNNQEAGFSFNDEGGKRANSKKAKELNELIKVVQEVDRKKAQELLQKFPELEEALKPPPKKDEEGGSGDNSNNSEGFGFAAPLVPFTAFDPNDVQQQVTEFSKAVDQIEKGMSLMEKDPKKALGMVSGVPPRYRASMICSLADSAVKKNPQEGQRVLNQCMSALAEVKGAGNKALAYGKVAEAARKLKNDELAGEALRKALDDIQATWDFDTDSKQPNVAPLEYRPSTVGTRLLAWSIKRSLGVDGDSILAGFNNNDLALFAYVELGRALLDLTRREWSIQVAFSDSK